MKLNTFEAGLSVRIDPSLINVNEAVVYSNIDNSSLVLKSEKDLFSEDIQVANFIHNFNDEWLSNSIGYTYVEYMSRLYFTTGVSRPQKYDGYRYTNLGIDAPVDKATATQADPTDTEKVADEEVTLQYTYTYYNSQDDVESAPAPISDELVLAANKVVDITGILPSDDVQVDKIRIYRLGDSITTMTLVEEVDNITYYRDDTETLDLPGSILDTYSNQVPLNSFKYLIEAYGILFAADGDKLYFSEIGKPDYWPASNFIQFPKPIKGLLPVQEGILVMASDRIHILVGTEIANFNKQKLTNEHGCIAHVSCNEIKSIPVWLSYEGVVLFSGGSLEVISKAKLGNVIFSVVDTEVYDETYFIVLSDGTVTAMDLRFNSIAFKKYSFSKKIKSLHKYNGKLYASDGNKLYNVFAGEEMLFYYKSGVLTEGEHAVTKLYNNIYINLSGEFTVSIYIDGTKVSQKDLSGSGIFDITPPAEEQRGASIQFEIQGQGTVYEIEYKVMGRQNGR